MKAAKKERLKAIERAARKLCAMPDMEDKYEWSVDQENYHWAMTELRNALEGPGAEPEVATKPIHFTGPDYGLVQAQK